MPSTRWRQGAYALAAFAVLAMVQSWPLPLHLATHLTGSPTGDTGVYVWNIWVFGRELLEGGRLPWRTLEILPLAGPVDLSLHNYTVFADLLALPILKWLGVVSTFNVIYLFNIALTGFGTFLLARRLTGRAPEAFLAGLMFAWSPFLVARSTGHFSLVAAAPLPFFLLFMHRAWDTRRVRDAVFAGVTMAWAAFCDPYYAVYCAMLGAAFVGSRVLAITLRRRQASELASAKVTLDVALVALVALIVLVNVVGGGQLEFRGLRVSMRTLYTPMLLLTVLTVARLAVSSEFRLSLQRPPSRAWMARATVAAVSAATLLLSPQLYAIGLRVANGTMVSAPVPWRSSAPGVDLMSFLLPNPNHALAPQAMVDWLTAGPGGYIDQVASLSWVGFAVLVAAWRSGGFRPGRFWPALTIGFGLLTLGPFLHVAGINTHIPTPWALLRYLPVVGAARMPPRFAVVAALGFAVLVALALAHLGRRFPARRGVVLAAVGLALVAELIPAPRTLYAATPSPIFERIAADPRPVRVLNLPFGVRDGLSSLGNTSAVYQFQQAFHGKGLVGGYLSRVSERRKNVYRGNTVVRALMAVSEGRKVPRHEMEHAIESVDRFLATAEVGYVVVDTARVSPDLRDFATILLGLTKIDEAAGYELFVPRGQPIPTGAGQSR